jgi:hypothetical protein
VHPFLASHDGTEINVKEEAIKLQTISEEIKADMKAGRYKGGQVHEHISAKRTVCKEIDISQFTEYDAVMGIYGFYRDGSSISRRYDYLNPSYLKEFQKVLVDHVKDRKSPILYMDSLYGPEYLYTKDRSVVTDDKINGPTSMSKWVQPIPPSKKVLGPGPSEAKKAKLRAKRKKNK